MPSHGPIGSPRATPTRHAAVSCDKPYAQGDRAAIAAGALEYLNTIAITLRKL